MPFRCGARGSYALTLLGKSSRFRIDSSLLILSSRTTTLSIVILSMCSFFECLASRFLRPESVCKVTAFFIPRQNLWQCLTLFNLFGAPARVPSALFPKSECKGTPFFVNGQIFSELFSRIFSSKTPFRRPRHYHSAIYTAIFFLES